MEVYVMSKMEITKDLVKHSGYLFGGITLILVALMSLGHILDDLVQIYSETSIPFPVSLIPLGIMVTGIGWGAYLIWKGQSAFTIAYGLICKLADVIALNRVSRKAKVLIGTPPMLGGIILLVVAIIQAAIRLGFDGAIMGIVSPLGLIGWVSLLFGLVVTHGLTRKRGDGVLQPGTNTGRESS